MSSTKRLRCPHCGVVVGLKFFDYANLRPGFLYCPACHRRIQFPVGVRLLAVLAGLVLGSFTLAVLSHGWYWNSSTLGGMALKVLAFLTGVLVLMAVMAFVCRGMTTRLEKVGRD